MKYIVWGWETLREGRSGHEVEGEETLQDQEGWSSQRGLPCAQLRGLQSRGHWVIGQKLRNVAGQQSQVSASASGHRALLKV